jgi:hypothetical protein
MPPKKGRGHAAVAFVKHAAHQLLGKDLIGAVRERAIHHIRPSHQAKMSKMMAAPASFAKGGKVMKTGLAKVHKGEVVLPKKGVAALKKMLK